MSLRLHLLEPSLGVVSGGTRVLVHGRGFLPPPHSLLVRFKVGGAAHGAARCVDVAGRYLLDAQLECVVPDLRAEIAARRASTAAGAAIDGAQSPLLVPVELHVVQDSEHASNALVLRLHAEIVVQRVTPQFVLLTPPIAVTATLNLLKLSTQQFAAASASASSSSSSSSNAKHDAKAASPEADAPPLEISAVPVFVRIQQTSERSGATLERVLPAQWQVSAAGVYEVTFEAEAMSFGTAVVAITLNRVDYSRPKDRARDATGFHVLRDVSLRAVDPCCVSVTCARTTEVCITGDGFVDSGDLVVRLLQRDVNDASASAPMLPVAQLNAAFSSRSVISCTLHPNMSFGLTAIQVSVNGGRQFSKDQVVVLLYRERMLERIEPAFASLEGGADVAVFHTRLPLEAVDAPDQLSSLVPQQLVRVKFEGLDRHGQVLPAFTRVVHARNKNQSKDHGEGVSRCTAPSFLAEMRQFLNDTMVRDSNDDIEVDEAAQIMRFVVSMALGNGSFFGSLSFGYFFPPVIRSITQHHGPSVGGTLVCMRMKHRVPQNHPIRVRFLSLSCDVYECVDATAGIDYEARAAKPLELRGSAKSHDTDPAFAIVCISPPWNKTPQNLPHLTKVQVSLDDGHTFVPELEDDERSYVSVHPPPSDTLSAEHRTRKLVAPTKDRSYLYYLFFASPRLRSVSPMSADIQGGSFIRITGENVLDHGGDVSVIFQSTKRSLRVTGVVENGEIHCCTPPFDVGAISIFVSLNGEQYTKCEFEDPDSHDRIDFVYYSSPSLRRISPLCTCVRRASSIRVFGDNLIETGRLKVRFSFHMPHGRVVFKDATATARQGVITTQSPLFSMEYADMVSMVDVALNGTDFSGAPIPLYYYASYSIRSVSPPMGAADIPISLTLSLSQSIVSDAVVVRIRFKTVGNDMEQVFGPVDAAQWENDRVTFTLPAIVSYAENAQALASAVIDLSFDRSYFHEIGELLGHYRVYNIPRVTALRPLFGPFDTETMITAKCRYLDQDDVVKIAMRLDEGDDTIAKQSRTDILVVAESNAQKQTLSWICPPLQRMRELTGRPGEMQVNALEQRMLLPVKVRLQISTIDGQIKDLPFQIQFFRTPTLVRMNPRIGYVCGGSIVSLEFSSTIETPTVDVRFGAVVVRGALKDAHTVDCVSPVMETGKYELSLSFDGQHFVQAVEMRPDRDEGDDDTVGVGSCAAVFHVVAMPTFRTPTNRFRVYGFGPTTGGSTVAIHGRGFIPNGKVHVRFCSPFRDGFGEFGEVVVVKARVVDNETMLCIAPPCSRSGRVLLEITYNLQQFTDSTGFFEYHETTLFASHGILCGPVSGGTPLRLSVPNSSGLPEDHSLVHCALRFQGVKGGMRAVDASFDQATRELCCLVPDWPSNELVEVYATLESGTASPLFVDTQVHFLFYDPPQGLIRLEPSCGPISGGTCVMAWCGNIVDTGEIMVSITMVDQVEQQVLESQKLPSEPSSSLHTTQSGSSAPPQVFLVKGHIMGDAVRFETPAVTSAGLAYLHISLNGINYTSLQSSALRFTYYMAPRIQRITPMWAMVDEPIPITLHGDHIQGLGSTPVVRFQMQQSDGDKAIKPILVDGELVQDVPNTLRCVFLPAQPGCYEIEVSLNGQQFSASRYMNAKYGNYTGTACTMLLPFRCFASPFFLATPTGSVAGGSSVVLYLGRRVAKLLARETRCPVQFSIVRLDASSATSASVATASSSASVGTPVLAKTISSSPLKVHASLDPAQVLGDIDAAAGRITCRAPLLRSACVTNVDIVLPASPETKAQATTSCATLFGVKDREKYYAYEAASISDLTPTCGPVTGGTTLVIEGNNILDTGQIFVRFRSSLNERECVLVPGTFSKTFPDGSISGAPLITCRTPSIHFVDHDSIGTAGVPPSPAASQSAASVSSSLVAGRVRMQTYQQMADHSLKTQQHTLKITRMLMRTGKSGGSYDEVACCSANVLVDFTLNAGEQFISHSVPFHFHADLCASEVEWGPHHLPTQSISRMTTDARMLTLKMPKRYRLIDPLLRMAVHLEGVPQAIYSKHRGSSVVLHEGNGPRELLLMGDQRLKTQTTMRRPSTLMRGTAGAATTSNLLALCGAANATIEPAPRPSPRGERGRANAGVRPMPGRLPTSSPYIAAKPMRGSDVACPVPEFTGEGALHVSFSLNAQQFVQLGDLHVHTSLVLQEDDAHRFCPTTGGQVFVAHTSLSSVFLHCHARHICEESSANVHSTKVTDGWMRTSIALDDEEESTTCISVEASGSIQYTPDPASAIDSGMHWRPRVFRAVQVHLVPPNARLLKRAQVSSSRLGSQCAISSCAVDEFGRCLLEATDWRGEVQVAAMIPESSGLSTRIAIQMQSLARAQIDPIRLVLAQLPGASALCVAVYSSFAAARLRLMARDNKELARAQPQSTDELLQAIVVNPSLLRTDVQAYICIDSDTAMLAPAEEGHDIHVVVSDSKAVKLYLRGRRHSWTRVWIVARLTRQDDRLLVAECDQVVDTLADLEVSITPTAPLPVNSLADVRADPLSSGTPLQLQFANADSSLDQRCVVPARIVLPGASITLSRLMQDSPRATVRLECDLPYLPFTGPSVVSVLVDGVVFSNSICAQVYDPQQWAIARLEPSCAPEGQPLCLRIHGAHFVDNHRVFVRFSDAHQCADIPARTAREHVLFVRVASISNWRALYQVHTSSSTTAVQQTGITAGSEVSGTPHKQAHRDDDRRSSQTSTYGGCGPSGFCLTLTCGDCAVTKSFCTTSFQDASDEQFELRVAESHSNAPLLVTIETNDPDPVEIARCVIPLNDLPEAVLVRRRVRICEHFHRTTQDVLAMWQAVPNPSIVLSSEMEILLHLSPSMLDAQVIECQLPPFDRPKTMCVQVSSGDNFLSACAELDQDDNGRLLAAPAASVLQVYKMPTVTHVLPQVLPRSRGGEITLYGDGFLQWPSAACCVWLFACHHPVVSADEERELLRQINAIHVIPPKTPAFFVHSVSATVANSHELRCRIPPQLATFAVYMRASMDGRTFSEASPQMRVLLFAADTVEPPGGPASGNTYVALRGVNLSACVALHPIARVRLTWTRAEKDLESVVVDAETYPSEDVVYFYTPPSKFGLRNITVQVELSLQPMDQAPGTAPNISANASPSTATSTSGRQHFTQDDVPFVVYKAPVIRSLTPTRTLIGGVTRMELSVLGLEHKALSLLASAHRLRFQRRGQMQIADVQMSGDKVAATVPRFHSSAAESIVPKNAAAPTKATPDSNMKLWHRRGMLVVVLLRARNLHAAKKATCNPLVTLLCDNANMQQASTRKEGTYAPVWNEIFEFEWGLSASRDSPSDTTSANTVRLRVFIENQLTVDQSEVMGQVDLELASPPGAMSSFVVRSWFSVRRSSKRTGHEPALDRGVVGEVELALVFAAPAPKKASTHLPNMNALRSSILSVVQHKPQQPQPSIRSAEDVLRQQKEKIVRAFRRQSVLLSGVPNELTIELAANGQDFCSSAPSKCFLSPTPLVVNAQPPYICASGGTPLTITGMNFVATGVIRVAFALMMPRTVPKANDCSSVVVVDGKFRSSTCITCVTPSLVDLAATGDAEIVSIHVAMNGVDFDSIALPMETRATTFFGEMCTQTASSTQDRAVTPVCIDLSTLTRATTTDMDERPMRCLPLWTKTVAPQQRVLSCIVGVFQTPQIRRIRAADGVYTTRLAIEGTSFTATGIAIARFQSISDENDVRDAPLDVIAADRMECVMPDFSRGSLVRISVSINGLEFVEYPDNIRVVPAPCLTEIVPSWVFRSSTQPLLLRGVHFAQDDDKHAVPRVSFSLIEGGPVIVTGQCDGGDVVVTIPAAVLEACCSHKRTNGSKSSVADANADVVSLWPSVRVDICLGGAHKKFTGKPLLLRIFSVMPVLTAISPDDGPIYGGFPMALQGENFVDTKACMARFELCADITPSVSSATPDAAASVPPPSRSPTLERSNTALKPCIVDVPARFVSTAALSCTAPSFPCEGIFSVSVSLNGVEFSQRNPALSVLVWHNWQRRWQCMPSAAIAVEEAHEEQIDGMEEAATSETVDSSPRRQTKKQAAIEWKRVRLHSLLAQEACEHDDDRLVDVRWLQWHPAAVVLEEERQSFVELVSSLCEAPETQPIMLRRFGYVFRTKGTRGSDTHHSWILDTGAFADGLQLLFPTATDEDVAALWHRVDPQQLGHISLKDMMLRLLHLRNEDEHRPHSPEPGPAHYVPNFAATERRASAALILPSTPRPTEVAGLPSELSMDWDAFKIVRPRVVGGSFPKRKFTTSWCNPATAAPTHAAMPTRATPRAMLATTDSDEIERQFAESMGMSMGGAIARQPSLRDDAATPPPRPAPPAQRPSSLVPRGDALDEVAEETSAALADRPRPSIVSRADRMAVVAEKSATSRPPQAAEPSVNPSANANANASRAAARSGKSLLYGDIAPLYLKFFSMAEAQQSTSKSKKK